MASQLGTQLLSLEGKQTLEESFIWPKDSFHPDDFGPVHSDNPESEAEGLISHEPLTLRYHFQLHESASQASYFGILQGRLEGDCALLCGLCQSRFTLKLSADYHYKLFALEAMDGLADLPEDGLAAPGKQLSLAQLTQELIALNLPWFPRCQACEASQITENPQTSNQPFSSLRSMLDQPLKDSSKP